MLAVTDRVRVGLRCSLQSEAHDIIVFDYKEIVDNSSSIIGLNECIGYSTF